MSYAFIQDVPANEAIYGQIRAKLGAVAPAGLIAHIVVKREAGLRYIDIWDTDADWQRFRDDRLEPVVGEVLAGYGIPHDHTMVSFEDIEVIDTWFGATVAVH
jgi:hypothetical protein